MKLMYKLLVAITMLMQMCSSNELKTTNSSSASSGRVLEFVGSLSFLDDTNTISTIRIALADDDNKRSLGLMDVTSMKQDEGMLFIFDVQERQNFWMANTPLPLDLIFADEFNQIVHVHNGAVPFSKDGIDSIYPAKYVIEVNAGYAVEHDIRPGMTFTYNLD